MQPFKLLCDSDSGAAAAADHRESNDMASKGWSRYHNHGSET